MNVAVLGPGGVGGFVAAALARAGTPVTVVAREETAARIARDGLRVESVRFGALAAHPAAVAVLDARADVLVVAVKAPALDTALARVGAEPDLVVPLLNGVEHLGTLRARFGDDRVIAGTIRIAAHRPAPGHVVHTSPVVRVDLAPPGPADAVAHLLRAAEIPARVQASEAVVLWTKLARLCPLALCTAASGLPIGAVRTHPRWRATLLDAVAEVVAVAAAAGAALDACAVVAELMELRPEQTSSLARDVEAGAPTELDAIGGAVLRAAARHAVAAPAVAELVAQVAERVR